MNKGDANHTHKELLEEDFFELYRKMQRSISDSESNALRHTMCLAALGIIEAIDKLTKAIERLPE